MFKNIVLTAMVFVLALSLSACAGKNPNRLPNVEDIPQSQKMVKRLYAEHDGLRHAYIEWIGSSNSPITGAPNRVRNEHALNQNISFMLERIQTQIVELLHSDINGVQMVDNNIRRPCSMIDQLNDGRGVSEKMSMHLGNMSMCVDTLKMLLDPQMQAFSAPNPENSVQPNTPAQATNGTRPVQIVRP